MINKKPKPSKNIDEIFAELKKGLKEVFNDSEKYLNFLRTTSSWHKYSINNKINLWMQCFERRYEGKYLNTFKGWKDLGYSVKKDSKAMDIVMPKFQKYFKDKDNRWVSTRCASENELKDIKAGKYQIKETISSFFLKKAIFDISQTNCPQEEYEKSIREKVYPKTLEESQDNKIDFLFLHLKKYIQEKEKLPVRDEDLENSLKGYVTKDEIVLNANNSNLQNLKTLIHEYTHYKLHITSENKLQIYQNELEAESVAYMVCSAYEIDTSEYSFKYINMYAAERTDEELYNSYNNITLTANTITEVLDVALAFEIANNFEAGDIVYANLESQEDNKYPDLLYLIEKDGEKYSAFKITSEENNYIVGVSLDKDPSNNLSDRSVVTMDIKYAVKPSDIVNKVGSVTKEDLTNISKHIDFFTSKDLIKDYNPSPAIKNTISMDNSLDMSMNLSMRRG